MKKLSFALVLMGLVSFSVYHIKLTDAEREKAVDHLTTTRDNLLSAVEGLSEEQLNFKSDPEAWSVAECVEHLAISEDLIWQSMEGAKAKMADVAQPVEVSMTDDQLLGMITDRTNKVKTQEPFEPSGQFGSHEATVEAFADKREAHIEYIKETEDDLRSHYTEFPFGTVDAYQVVLFMSGHTARHLSQIEEIKAHADFPSE